jgi:SnoaL-like protein
VRAELHWRFRAVSLRYLAQAGPVQDPNSPIAELELLLEPKRLTSQRHHDLGGQHRVCGTRRDQGPLTKKRLIGKSCRRTARNKHTEWMSTDDSPQSVASAYFDAWTANDIERVRPLLQTDVDFVGALGKTHGVAETLSGLGGMFAMTRQVEVIHRWVDGPDVLTWFELRTATAGPMAIVNWSHVEDGRITWIRVTFDPRPMLG